MIPIAVVVSGAVAKIKVAIGHAWPARFAADTREQHSPFGVVAGSEALWIAIVHASVAVVVQAIAAFVHASAAAHRSTRSVGHIAHHARRQIHQ